MIRQAWRINTKPFDDLAAFTDSFATLVTEIGERVIADQEDDLLDELRFYPPPRQGQVYQRTYRLRDGWTVDMRETASGFEIEIANNTRYAKYVVGSLAQARSAAARFQARIHQGRWPLATDTLSFWFEAFMQDFEQAFAAELSAFGSTSSARQARTR